MKKRLLGKTGLKVTELCFGALPMGPIQKNIKPQQGARLIRKGIEAGINFIDTAELYQTYDHIAPAIKGYEDKVIITSKSSAIDKESMKKSVEKARRELERDYVDIFLLHAAREDRHVFEKRAGALEYLLEAKEKGLIKAVGISCHAIEVVDEAAKNNNIDVIFTIINKTGIGIIDGSAQEMEKAIANADAKGKGLYAMKALGGGNLISDYLNAFQYVRNLPGIASVAVGMVSEKELDMNLRLFTDQKIDPQEIEKLKSDKHLQVLDFCIGCGTCIEHCPNDALSLAKTIDGMKAQVDKNRCILCGYCNPYCPEFALRMS